MKKSSRSRHSTLNELNITPLLDLVFVLLVIFIITTPQLVNSLEMSLPSGKPPPQSPAEKPKISRIDVDARGQASLNGAPLDLPSLKVELQKLKASDARLSVVVRGADEVEYQRMVTVLDLLQKLDITRVGLATESTTSDR